MTRKLSRTLLVVSFFAALLTPIAHADQWTQPTPEELFMTSQPEVPGAPAVYLYREQITQDNLHVFKIYVRLKVLNERGKDFGNVELNYFNSEDGGYTVNDVAGRTIHPDGTAIPFTGKPYEKLIEKSHGTSYMAKVFSMPSVEVGSIIEYRYTLRYGDHHYFAPDWYIQSNLFTRKAHYLWEPTDRTLVTGGKHEQLTNSISWTPILPAGTVVQQSRLPGDYGHLSFEVNIQNVPPAPEEEFMPPVSSFTYRVLFYYSAYRTMGEFWKNEGKFWSEDQDKFIGPGHAVDAAVQQLTAASDSPDQKLRKLYAAVQQMENTDLTRAHSTAEEKSQGLGQIHNTDDILTRKRGSSDQLTELFVAMARAAGFKSYLASVTNRDNHLFLASYLSLSQLDDYLAIVVVDGKEVYFDPGSHFCPYQHLAWKHTAVGGLRQTEHGTELLTATPSESYNSSRIQRVANLTMDPHGLISGTVYMTYIGAPALRWRQLSITGDTTSLGNDLRTSLESQLPHGLDIKLIAIDKLADYEQPLVARFVVTGSIGSSTGKRLLIPGDLFEANTTTTFPHEKREIPIYFHYPYRTLDAIRITFPKSFALESLPKSDSFRFQQYAAYSLNTESASNSVTIRRDFALADVLFPTTDYPALRTYYNQFEAKDQETVVLKAVPEADQPATSGN